jgi:hypothetical protein
MALQSVATQRGGAVNEKDEPEGSMYNLRSIANRIAEVRDKMWGSSHEQLDIIEAVLEGISEEQTTLISQALSGQLRMGNMGDLKELEKSIREITAELEDTPCPTCGGTGDKFQGQVDGCMEYCPTCGGRGSFAEPNGLVELCPTCHGTGRER